MFTPYGKEGLYIAGPECFYRNGYELWWAQRKLAEYHGLHVVLPTSTHLKLDDDDARMNAKEIFDDLVVQIDHTTAIIADLEIFRGCEPDGGTVFELGWVWSRYGRLYGYSRDLRPMAVKNQQTKLVGGRLLDQNGWPHPYGDLPFCPSIVGSTKIIEGGFPDALRIYLTDLDEDRKALTTNSIVHMAKHPMAMKTESGSRVYLSGPERYSPEAETFYSQAKELCLRQGYHAVCPLDDVEGMIEPPTADPVALATFQFIKSMALLASSDVVLANLNDFHGWEPNNDVAFECGVAYGLGKTCYGYMSDARPMRERIPHYGEDRDNRDWCGNVVEHFNYPINLMFACSMPVVAGDLERIILTCL